MEALAHVAVLEVRTGDLVDVFVVRVLVEVDSLEVVEIDFFLLVIFTAVFALLVLVTVFNHVILEIIKRFYKYSRGSAQRI